jgi:hypothetical protein
MEEKLPNGRLNTHGLILSILEQAYAPDSDIEMKRKIDSEIVEGRQENGAGIIIGRPLLEVEDDDPAIKEREVVHVEIQYTISRGGEEQPIEYQRFYSFGNDGQMLETVRENPVLFKLVGPGEHADIHEIIAKSDFTSY